MRRLMIATAAGAALLAGATAANAQYYYDDGYAYGYRGPLVERSVGLQVGPVGIYPQEPTIYAQEPTWYAAPVGQPYLRGDHPNSTFNSRAFRSQEWYPQSPPGGG